MTIMLIDDSATMRKIVKMNLKSLNCEIVEANNGQEAIEKVGEQKVDVFIVDFNMPVMNGLEFGKKIRTLDTYTDTPIIFLTTESDKDLEEDKKSIGVKGWLKKPFKKDQLLALLDT